MKTLLLLALAILSAGEPVLVFRTHTGDVADLGAVPAGDRLLVGSSRKISEVDATTGAILRFLLPLGGTPLSSAPLPLGETVLAGDAAGRVLAWTDGVFPAIRAPSFRARAITVLAAWDDGFLEGGDGGCVSARGPGGERVWFRCTGGPLGAVRIAGDRVLAADSTGQITAWEPRRGGLRWTYRTDTPVATTPPLAGDAVVLAGTDGHLYALDPARGTLRWRLHVGDGIPGAAVVAGGRILVATRSRGLVAVDADAGRIVWRAPLPDSAATPAVIGELILAGATDGVLRAFDAATGAGRWELSLGGEVVLPAVAAGSLVLVVTRDGEVIGLR
ncbi:MAG: PQQ-binding-like beta-propeller repeat protein [Deltaproteobacteria bacterium]|nr:PQQ-binding-like beta-propeller repeat protein [Deltaproteobacteria bacterium]